MGKSNGNSSTGSREKLGISSSSRALWIGPAEPAELRAAIGETESLESERSNLIVISADTPFDLVSALEMCRAHDAKIPVWIIYRKGKRAFGETAIRDLLRHREWIDTKVVSVSPTFTGLRFVKRSGSVGS